MRSKQRQLTPEYNKGAFIKESNTFPFLETIKTERKSDRKLNAQLSEKEKTSFQQIVKSVGTNEWQRMKWKAY